MFSGFRIVFVCLTQLYFTLSFSQIKIEGVVTDANTKAPLEFVNVVGPNYKGAVADVDGKFSISVSTLPTEITFSYLGYETKKIIVKDQDILKITLFPSSFKIQEVTIFPGENPAWRIVRTASAKRRLNNPEVSLNFKYNSYNKSIISVDDIFFFDIDSVKDTAEAFLNNKYLMFTESYSQRNYESKLKDREIVLKSRISGYKNSPFALLASASQSFSFYEDLIDIFGRQYLSPLTKNGENYYRYELIDTNYVGLDTIFVITYEPKLKSNFDGLKGQLYINTDGYAIQNVTSEIASTGGFYTFKIRQQYQKIEGNWFPEQYDSYMAFGLDDLLKEKNNNSNGIKYYFKGKCYISNVILNPQFTKEDFGIATTDMADGAGIRDSAYWENHRAVPLDEKEFNTYLVMDSLGEEAKSDQILKVLEWIVTEKIPVGAVSLDINEFLKFNEVENLRLGVGAYTNNKISRYFSVGGAIGYGIKDKRLKYKTSASLFLKKDDAITLTALYQNDLIEPGSVKFKVPGPKEGNIREWNVNRMDEIQISQIGLKARIGKYIIFEPFLNQQVRTVSGYSYQYTTSTAENVQFLQDKFRVNQSGFNFKVAIGERFTRLFGILLSDGCDYPVLNFKYTNAGNLVPSDIEYNQYDLQLDHKKSFKLLGTLRYRIAAGYTDQVAPYSFLYNLKGNYTKTFGAVAFGTFQTMRFNEFLADRYLSLHFKHDLRTLLFKSKKFKPGIFVSGNGVVGTLQNPEVHNEQEYQIPNKVFYEGGLEFTNLLKVNTFFSFGLGGFYRLGHYQLPSFSDNIALRLNLTLNLD